MLNIIVYDHMEERLDEKTRVNWNENSKISDTFSLNDAKISIRKDFAYFDWHEECQSKHCYSKNYNAKSNKQLTPFNNFILWLIFKNSSR